MTIEADQGGVHNLSFARAGRVHVIAL